MMHKMMLQNALNILGLSVKISSINGFNVLSEKAT